MGGCQNSNGYKNVSYCRKNCGEWGWVTTSAVFSFSLDLFSVVVIFILVSYFEGLESQKMQGLLFQRGFEERMKRM